MRAPVGCGNIRRLVEPGLKASRMVEDDVEHWEGADGSQEGELTPSERFDRYRSVVDSNLMIIVAKDVVPPFRFKAGGWDLIQSSIEVGSAMKVRIAENGFFMFRINPDQDGGVELTDIPPRS